MSVPDAPVRCTRRRMMFQKLHGAFEQGERVRILDTDDFGYTTVTVNRPMHRPRCTMTRAPS